MLAHGLASKPCSEATNTMISLFHFLTVDIFNEYAINFPLGKERTAIGSSPNQGRGDLGEGAGGFYVGGRL